MHDRRQVLPGTGSQKFLISRAGLRTMQIARTTLAVRTVMGFKPRNDTEAKFQTQKKSFSARCRNFI